MVVFLFGMAVSVVILLAEWAHKRGNDRAFLQAQENRRSFIRRLDHELKNPLTGLRAALANLSESASSEDREQASLNAHRDVERLQRLLADLRKLSDLDEIPLETLPVQIPELLEEIVEAAGGLPVYHGRSLSLLIANVPPLPPVIGDRDLLGLAFYNLIDNALKFSGPGNAIQVRAREDGRSVVVEVADGGPGIPAEDLPHIFEELYRGTNARGIPGSGLGLALAARIVNLHGGTLKVTSRQGERQGTVFSMVLPAGRIS
jgi:two-component system OmpR family sensor kinase